MEPPPLGRCYSHSCGIAEMSLRSAFRAFFERRKVKRRQAQRMQAKTEAEKAREIELLVQSGVSAADRFPPPSL